MLEVARLANEDLIDKLKNALRTDAKLEAELLLLLGEVDARQLYLDHACSSMFLYCTRVLGLSEACAYHRIGAARAARRFPAIFDEISAGSLHSSGVNLLASHLTPQNVDQWVVEARGKSKRELEILIANRRPKPTAPSSVRKLPEQKRESRSEPAPSSARPVGPTPKPEPLGGERFKIQFTATRELREKLEEAQTLLSHRVPMGDIAEVFDRALDLLIKETKRARFAETDRPRTQIQRSGQSTRHIPATLRRQVYERDQGRCAYVGKGGRRCGARERLEFHHRIPWARTQDHSLRNLTLLCQAHNQHVANLDFGRDWMQSRRRSGVPDH